MIATPLALIVLGGQFQFKQIVSIAKPLAITVVNRLIVIPAIALIGIYYLLPRFEGAAFAGFVALFASPVAVTSAIIAKELGGDEDLAGQLVVWTTLLSVITIMIIVIILRTIGIF